MGNCDLVESPSTASVGSSLWYALHTRSRHEKKVAADLERRGIHAFLPLVTEVHKWSDRRRTVEVPLFSCYVFVNIFSSAEMRVSVLRTAGVVGLLGGNNLGTPIPESQIKQIESVVARKVPFAAHPFLEIGQRVRVCGGMLDGIEGILTRCNGSNRLVLSVDTIQRSLSVSIEGYKVEAIRGDAKVSGGIMFDKCANACSSGKQSAIVQTFSYTYN